ncbi:glycosyl transferase [Virgisporangium aliadipatigenens]|uniref:Glycosyl transferase n=1 Tax=Virgisporangium aliadipatigenens TaxID=741659 RepID=A0A8J4DW76_9ACTN|nr:glycosyltransferase family 4 protein [Virgisporangium aliadipatigenens]GIJ51958.1 glycosyl transferase [Virgisporangium aliadipatigenens]
MVARVGLVLASSTGGVGRHLASLAAGLVADGVEVTVFGPAATGRDFGFAGLGAGFVPVEIPATPQPRDALAVRALGRGIAATRPQVLHAHGLRAGLVAGLARGRTLPFVVTWHNQVMGSGLRRLLLGPPERYVARAADVTLGASSDLVERVRALGGRDVRLAPVAAPDLPPPSRGREAVRAEFGVAEGRPLVLCVGRLHPQKRHDVLIDAAVRMTSKPVVVIAGSGPEHDVLAARIAQTNAPVVLAGHRDDVNDLLGAADLAVVASDWEARQLFAQEALRAGVPLVATRVGGLPELVGDAAVWIPAGDAVALAHAVDDLLGDPARLRMFHQKSLETARSWPTEAGTVAQVLGVYRELAP